MSASNTKAVSELPSITAHSGEEILMRSGSSLSAMLLHDLLAVMLVPGANVIRDQRNIYTRTQWLEFSMGTTFWNMWNGNPGDVLVMTGTTSDTQQAVVYFFLATSLKQGQEMYGKCFLLLLEGEPPRWANTAQ